MLGLAAVVSHSYKLGFVRNTRARNPRLRIGSRLELWLAARGCPRGLVAGCSFGSPCLTARAQVLPRWSSPDENSKRVGPRPVPRDRCSPRAARLECFCIRRLVPVRLLSVSAWCVLQQGYSERDDAWHSLPSRLMQKVTFVSGTIGRSRRELAQACRRARRHYQCKTFYLFSL
jgi:hypothetical protein